MQDEFSSIDNIKVQVCTWNMGGVKPFESVDLGDWLFPGGSSEDNPDVFIIGFQEIIALKTSKFMNFGGGNKADVELFKNLIIKNLNKYASSDEYKVCRE